MKYVKAHRCSINFVVFVFLSQLQKKGLHQTFDGMLGWTVSSLDGMNKEFSTSQHLDQKVRKSWYSVTELFQVFFINYYFTHSMRYFIFAYITIS
jgi:hypothetical protein